MALFAGDGVLVRDGGAAGALAGEELFGEEDRVAEAVGGEEVDSQVASGGGS